MASAHKIRMDFELAKRQAQRLEEVAGKMDRIADGQMADAMERLAAGWTGENSVKFIKKKAGYSRKWAPPQTPCAGWRIRSGRSPKTYMKRRWRHTRLPVTGDPSSNKKININIL